MAYGGGKYNTQNKILPGFYYKLLSEKKDAVAISDRGKVACGLELDWGTEGAIVSLSAEQFQKNASKYLGYDSISDKLTPVREMFRNATKLIFYRLNGGGEKASCSWATAKYSGTRGNDITIVIAAAVDATGYYDVMTYLADEKGNKILKDSQRVNLMANLVDNDFVTWKKTLPAIDGVYKYTASSSSDATSLAATYSTDTTFDVVASGSDVLFTQKVPGVGDAPTVSGTVATQVTEGRAAGTVNVLAEDAGATMTSGTNGTVTGTTHQAFLTALERVHYHCLACNSTDATTIALYIAYQKRMSHMCGKVSQLVVYGYSINGETATEITPDSFDVIVLENKVVSSGIPAHYGIFWVAGAEAGVSVNKTVQNRVYNGEYAFKVDYTQEELAIKIQAGKFMFHETIAANDQPEIRVLDDINSFVTTNENEGNDYKKNQTIRVVYQALTDIGGMFNAKQQGQLANDMDGRDSFKGQIVKYLYDLQRIRAIQEVDESRVIVSEGDTDGAVAMALPLDKVELMFQCYSDVTVQ